MRQQMAWAAGALALALAGAAAAESWQVVGVSSSDVLNVRSGPGTRFGINEALPPEAAGLSKEVCVLLKPTPESPRSAAQAEWCAISQRGEMLGWVNARFLEPEPAGAQDGAEGLYLLERFAGARGCFYVGETALTAPYLDHARDLVACELGSAGHTQMLGRHELLDRFVGFDLFEVLR